METIFSQIIGVVLFTLGTVSVGTRIKQKPDWYTALKTCRTSHVLFWMGLALPGLAGILYPGVTHYDEILGVPSLPYRPVTVALGIPLLLAGLFLIVYSNRTLSRFGGGGPAFWLTDNLVSQGPYDRVRHPMSLGYYLCLVGIGLVAGSTTITLGSLLFIIPVHIFNLWYFEERELEVRLGTAYRTYRDRVPFLLPARNSAHSHA